MKDYKKEAAAQAFQLIQPGQVIGLGDGSTMLSLAQLIAADKALASSLTFASSSVNTIHHLKEWELAIQPPSAIHHLDIYFDGCDQFDRNLHALKSGGGIHTMEKIVASMADEFVLVGDSSKFTETLTTRFPIVIEVIPAASGIVIAKLHTTFQQISTHLRTHDNGFDTFVNDRGNYLLELKFDQLPELALLNTFIKMLPGVVDHSLFYGMATKAIISGPDGTQIISK